jgi:hypothetical protein
MPQGLTVTSARAEKEDSTKNGLQLQSDHALMCVALHIVTNCVPNIPQSDSSRVKGDRRPGLKIPLAC